MNKNVRGKNQKCITCWLDKELIETFDNKYPNKSLFIRECIIKAINDTNFYTSMILKLNNEVEENGSSKEKIL